VQAKKSLFENRIASIPEGDSKTKLLMAVTDTGQAIFTPTVRFRTSLIMWQIVPGRAIGTIIFPHRPPRPPTHIWPPAFPIHTMLLRLLQPFMLGSWIFWHIPLLFIYSWLSLSAWKNVFLDTTYIT